MGKALDHPGVYVTLERVMRMEHQARGFSFLPRQPNRSVLMGRFSSRLRGRGLDFEEIRRYVPGEDIRTMDWKVTARTRKPHTRVYREERERSALLVVDQRLTMFFGTRVNMKSVTAAEAAALVAWRVFGEGDRVGAVLFNDRELAEFRPRRSRRAVIEILGGLVAMNRVLRADRPVRSDPGMLNRALGRVVNLVKHDTLVFVVSDFFGVDGETRRAIRRVSRHNDVMLLMVYDPIARELPPAGRFVITDGVRQTALDGRVSRFRDRYPEVLKGRLRGLRGELSRYGVPVLPVHTAGETSEQLRRLLGAAPSRSSLGWLPGPDGILDEDAVPAGDWRGGRLAGSRRQP